MITTQVLENTPIRTIKGKVEHYIGSTLANTFNYDDNLISAEVSRIGSGKFYGYGVSQKIVVELRDKERALVIAIGDALRLYFKSGSNEYLSCFPNFTVTEVKRDENTNALTITGFDALHSASTATLNELQIEFPATIGDYATVIAGYLGLAFSWSYIENPAFELSYENGANFSGSEPLRDVLNAIAEATQTIYYVSAEDELIFKKLDVSSDAVYTVDKSQYFELECNTAKRLGAICSSTELGDNLTASLGVLGVETQYIKDNGFYTLREDLDTLLKDALAIVGGMDIAQFSCSWRGNYLLEIGDKVAFTTKDNNTITAYLVDDSIKYDGGFKQVSKWEYTESEKTASNSTTIGEAIKETYARVDKANKRIELVASETAQNSSNISQLEITTSGISSSVTKVEQKVNDNFESVNNDLETITERVNATMTATEVNIAIQTEVTKGTTQVTTVSNNFTFNDEGLRIAKSDSDMTTQITEDGMSVYRGGVSEENKVLIADNTGVKAENLHATTYLIIDTTSRFEDWEKDGVKRTACFWIGG